MTSNLFTPGLLWLLAGVVACGAEMLVPSGGYLLAPGLAACGVGLLTMVASLGFPGQVGAFVVLLAAMLTIPVLRRPGRPTLGITPVNAPDDEMLGRTCRAIAFHGAEGRVQVGDGSWPARVTSGPEPTPDALLQVVGRAGTTLIVALAPNTPGPTEQRPA